MSVVAPEQVLVCCPRCRGGLDTAPQGYRCPRCGTEYPIVAGIPDFRLRPDPWIGLADDRAKAERLEGLTRGLDFADAVRAYWNITPTTPAPLAARFVAHALQAGTRSREWLRVLATEEGGAAGPWLELGCGTGDLLEAAAAQGVTIVGVDIALRWLVVAGRRLGTVSPLVCSAAEHLPYPDRSFARVLAIGLLEHCPDPAPVLAEARRVLAPGGLLRLRTVNRFSLLPEPHVGLWGVGLMPRRWANAYVQWRTGHPYAHRPLSARELHDALRRAGFREVRVEAAKPLTSETSRLGVAGRAAACVYGIAHPVLGRGLLTWAAPLLEARGAA